MEQVKSFVAEVGATFWFQDDLKLFQSLDTVPSYTSQVRTVAPRILRRGGM